MPFLVNSHWLKRLVFALFLASISLPSSGQPEPEKTDDTLLNSTETAQVEIEESKIGPGGIFERAWRGGFVVFAVLLVLIFMSIFSWAILVSKLLHLRKLSSANKEFIKSFWDSRSLGDLNGKLNEYSYSPVKEVFKSGYAELIRTSQLREKASTNSIAFNAAIENMTRSLHKAKRFEKNRLEKFLPVLSITASAAPFIGLFGTVWGIMGAFEGIARTGSASLAAVAPGISEALIATAFGLAAAIPAVIGFNMAQNRIRTQITYIDGFSSDFLNIVERYLVTDKQKTSPNGPVSDDSQK